MKQEFQKEIELPKFFNEPRELGKQYGRNEIVSVKYSTGEVFNNKYKYVEKDIADGNCEIITC